MTEINVKNTLDIKIGGEPSTRLEQLETPKQLAVLPSAIPHIKPKSLVKVGDSVKIGSPMFFDKRDTRIQFLAPGAGTVSAINYGERRAIESIVIDVAAKESKEKLTKIEDLSKASREDVVSALLKNGVWPLLQAITFQNIPNPDETPPAIYVSVDNDEPHLPQAEVFLKGNEADFAFGLEILKKLADQVYVGASSKNQVAEIKSHVTHTLKGNYPANNPGVFLYYNKKSQAENKSWSIKAQELIVLAKALKTGEFPTERVVVLAGTSVKDRAHYQLRAGAPFSDLLKNETVTDAERVIAGGIFTGRKSKRDSFFGFYDSAVHVMLEVKAPEMFSFIKPGFDKPTFSRTYLSALSSAKDWVMNNTLNGGHRSCISCNQCPQTCPVGLQPHFLMKSLLAKDTEDAIHQGFLDCVDCGLCTYVCPSKIELDSIFSDGKADLAKEVLA